MSFGLAGTDNHSAPAALDFECRLDDGPWVACDSPKSYANLTAGPHTFSARALDPAGNTDSTPVSYTWTVDTVAPETTIDSGPPTQSGSTSATLHVRLRGRRHVRVLARQRRLRRPAARRPSTRA